MTVSIRQDNTPRERWIVQPPNDPVDAVEENISLLQAMYPGTSNLPVPWRSSCSLGGRVDVGRVRGGG